MVQRKTTIRYVWEQDFDAYVEGAKAAMREDESGNRFFYLKDVDDKLEVNLYTPNKVYLEQKIEELKAEFDGMSEPSDSELIKLGIDLSRYHELKGRIEQLEKELEKWA